MERVIWTGENKDEIVELVGGHRVQMYNGALEVFEAPRWLQVHVGAAVVFDKPLQSIKVEDGELV